MIASSLDLVARRAAARSAHGTDAEMARSEHGHYLWDSGRRIMAGHPPGREVVFAPRRGVPAGTTCR